MGVPAIPSFLHVPLYCKGLTYKILKPEFKVQILTILTKQNHDFRLLIKGEDKGKKKNGRGRFEVSKKEIEANNRFRPTIDNNEISQEEEQAILAHWVSRYYTGLLSSSLLLSLEIDVILRFFFFLFFERFYVINVYETNSLLFNLIF